MKAGRGSVRGWLFGVARNVMPARLRKATSARRRALSKRVSGSSSKEEAIFVALADLLHGDLADPQLRATMFRAVGLLPHVLVDDRAVDARGRRGVELIWVRPDTTEESGRP